MFPVNAKGIESGLNLVMATEVEISQVAFFIVQ